MRPSRNRRNGGALEEGVDLVTDNVHLWGGQEGGILLEDKVYGKDAVLIA